MIVAFPVIVEFPVTERSVPTNNFFAIAAPPAIVIAPPAAELVASVIKAIVVDPLNVLFPV